MSLKIPIALSKSTNTLVNVSDVPNGLLCNCYCAKCKEDLVAVNREIKQIAHFRHKSDSNCIFNQNYESYVHWLTKEIFKTIIEFYLPPIKDQDIKRLDGGSFQLKISKYIHSKGISAKYQKLLKDFDNRWIDKGSLNPSNFLLQNEIKINLEKCLTEHTYQTTTGVFRVDVILFSDNSELFIEPYLSSKVDDFKLRKIIDKDISTISIDLNRFISEHKLFYTIEDFKLFLVNDLNSKKWEHIRKSKMDQLKNNFFEKILPQAFDKIQLSMAINSEILQNIKSNLKKVELLHSKSYELKQQLKSIDINEIIKEIKLS